MTLNGLFILLMVILAAVEFFIGYLAGQVKEGERRNKELVILNRRINELMSQIEDEKWRCPECGEIRKGDARVEAGMKCGRCAYGY